METPKFWGCEFSKQDWQFEIRSMIALRLLERWGGVMAKVDGEDSAGRSRTVDVSPKETVSRAFAIADFYVEEAHRRGGIRHILPAEEQMRRFGKLDAIRESSKFNQMRAAGYAPVGIKGLVQEERDE